MSAVKEHPILFKGPMVRAILGGRKTQTRRVVTPHNSEIDGKALPVRKTWPLLDFSGAVVDPGFGDGAYLKVPHTTEDTVHRVRPKWQRRDQLWAKENWAQSPEGQIFYQADDYGTKWAGRWKPSIFMPRKVSRITLEIINIRVERLQEITTEDAMSEGVNNTTRILKEAPRNAFIELWKSINDKRGFGWHSNPWVWVFEFKRVEP